MHMCVRYQEFVNEDGGPRFHEEEDILPHSDTVSMIAQHIFVNITARCATCGMQFKAVRGVVMERGAIAGGCNPVQSTSAPDRCIVNSSPT